MAYRENGNRDSKGTGRIEKVTRERKSYSDNGKRYDSFRYDGSGPSGKEKRPAARSRNAYSDKKPDNRKSAEYRPIRTFNAEAADLNGNGQIDIGDAVMIVNIVVGKTDSE